jgi:two-component system, cell cycle response regulator
VSDDPKSGKPKDPQQSAKNPFAMAEPSVTHPYEVVPLEPGNTAEVVPSLIIISGKQMGQIFPVRAGEARIGRADDADLSIRDSSISRYHALLYRDPGGDAHIRDLGSTNGTFVNGKRIQDVKLTAGDRIQFGKATILKLDFHSRFEEELHVHLYEAGTRDPLTDIFNRKYFDQHLDADFRLALRHQEELSLMMIDIDNFKLVNDTHGHLAGDHVLRTLAPIFMTRLRKEDILARYGGEEFVIILRRTTPAGALSLANALRQLVEEASFEFKGTRMSITISVGVATLTHPTVCRDANELLAAADRAMYTAKQKGRNRAEQASVGAGPHV